MEEPNNQPDDPCMPFHNTIVYKEKCKYGTVWLGWIHAHLIYQENYSLNHIQYCKLYKPSNISGITWQHIYPLTIYTLYWHTCDSRKIGNKRI